MADTVLEVRYKGRKFRINELADLIKELPRKLRAPVLRYSAEQYIRYFKLYPRYKYVSRARAYGQQAGGPGWFSDKQRRYVMARIHDGTITPGRSNRTFEIKEAWHIEGKGVNIDIVNNAPGAVYLFDPAYQARQPALVGWQNVEDMQKEYEDVVTEAVWIKVIELADDMLEKIMTGGK